MIHVRRCWPPVSTFSIVARDPVTGDLGVAVQSKFLAVGAVVPWARAGVGAVATQAWANVTYGPRGLEFLAAGYSADEVVARLTGEDPGRAERQVGIVDSQGRAATFTGERCIPWAGSVVGEGFCCQGNILVGPEVVQAMADAYRSTTGTFAHRLVTALEAGQAAGGDSRGQQSAAILIVREGGGYGGGNDRYIDLRVDDHPQPIAELRRLVMLHRVYFQLDEADLVPLDPPLLRRIGEQLHRLGYLAGSQAGTQATLAALERFASVENLEARFRTDGQVDTVLLEFLEARSQGRAPDFSL
ncbi:DUF1028 domain-containing protein [Thermomicrobiaceae bacterium CFH 74404]|uniref:DUF1028 domain-containing protein n=1 Tax=Thermalbibacter longus TaxID=2951981 RepID=A0AA41WHD2_9BACT|nr:DUF1028 domain-containing protein [Thermalbibacter longus]MCM8750065.1 DUF1028 domain-containing protein [Thermalbibacter longus]